MIDSTMDPRLAASVADTKDLDRFKSQMDGLKQNLSAGDQNKMAQLRTACQNFEAVFIGKLWEQMKQSVPKEGYLHSKQEDTYMSMFDRDFSEKMAQAGGIGLADMIFDQLSSKLKQASHDTLSGGVSIDPVQGIPLKNGTEPIALNRSKGMTLEDWGGDAVIENSKGTSPVETPEERPAAEGALSDVEVKARLESLTRRLEAQRIREGLTGKTAANGTAGYGKETVDGDNNTVGRKLAEIG